jgi:haloalkane dehalogenase
MMSRNQKIKPINRRCFEHLYPFTSHYLNINGLRYHYLDEGRGDPMIMLHGNPTWSFYYRNLILAFRGKYRVIVPDHMGCGLSDKPDIGEYGFSLADRVRDLSALTDHLALDRPVTLMLHDWGGMIGLAWALEHLDRTARLIITNTSGFFPPGHRNIPIRLRVIRIPNPLFNKAVLHGNLFARAALFMAPHRRLPRDVRSGLIAPYNCPRHRLATLKFVQDIPLGPQDGPSGKIVARVDQHLAEIGNRPTTIIWGAHDFVFTRHYFEQWRYRLPEARAHWLEDAGHYLFEDQPRKIINLIGEFLNANPIDHNMGRIHGEFNETSHIGYM